MAFVCAASIVFSFGVFGSFVLQSVLDDVGREIALAQFQGTAFAMYTTIGSSVDDAFAGFNGIHATMQVTYPSSSYDFSSQITCYMCF